LHGHGGKYEADMRDYSDGNVGALEKFGFSLQGSADQVGRIFQHTIWIKPMM